uniref:Uncharacterized protein n=1 Tax=Anguilla anguilla TaxID=7936 RepID=A0A0E9UKE1_ANGAN
MGRQLQVTRHIHVTPANANVLDLSIPLCIA